jgi:hypothetical protein
MEGINVPTKQAALELLNKLPDDGTWDDIMSELFVRQKIEAGIADADARRAVSHEEVFAELNRDDDMTGPKRRTNR